MTKLNEIRKLREERMSALFRKTGVFFAFSDKQFEENKTPIAEGETYTRLGGGGFLPTKNTADFHMGFSTLNAQYDSEITDAGLEDAEIAYELANHECWYTGDIEDVVEMFEGRYDRERIRAVYAKHSNENRNG